MSGIEVVIGTIVGVCAFALWLSLPDEDDDA